MKTLHYNSLLDLLDRTLDKLGPTSGPGLYFHVQPYCHIPSQMSQCEPN